MRAALHAAAGDQHAVEAQRRHWTRAFAERADRYGGKPSEPAKAAAPLFASEDARALLELGAGQGRDTLYFAARGLDVVALDYAESALAAVRAKARTAALEARIATRRHDARRPLPFNDESFDACYAHMLFCMAFTTRELEHLAREVRRVLRQRGLLLYTVRTTADPDYGRGTVRGEDMFEAGGFIVHFFGRDLVDRLSRGYELLDVAEFEEGSLPRRLYRVTMRKA